MMETIDVFGGNCCRSRNERRWQKHVDPLTPAVIKKKKYNALVTMR
jgi:hypothetical protein